MLNVFLVLCVFAGGYAVRSAQELLEERSTSSI